MGDGLWVRYKTETGHCEYETYVENPDDPSNRSIRCGNKKCQQRWYFELQELAEQIHTGRGRPPSCPGCNEPYGLPTDNKVWQFLIKDTMLGFRYGSKRAPTGR